MSHAKNLAEWTGKEGDKPLAGIRLELPDRLLADFKSLEQYGHALRAKHKAGLKRHIKMDDARLCLYMDVFVPRIKEWTRVDVEMARSDNAARIKRSSKLDEKKRELLSTAVEDDSEEEK